jgi:peptidoglycan/xylan/chitin deacetylase (PgdA/CDA1 family)
VAIKANRKKRINQPLIIFSGLVFLAASILVYFFILRGVFGKFSTDELIPNTKAVNEIFYGPKPAVAILYSKYTENMLPEGSTWLNDNINTWEKFLSSSKFGFKVISDSTIEIGQLSKYKILILPGSKSLSDLEIMQIKKFINSGGSIFATSGTASYSSDGKWRGWSFFSEVYGLKFSREISRDEVTKIHTLRGGLPITANIPAGFPLRVATWDRPMSVEVLDPRTIQASFWYNYRLQEGLEREQIKKSAGIVYGTYGKGRFVWMGFEINSVIGVQEDYIYFDRLFQNCMDWLSYLPIAIIKAWPNNYTAAAILAPELSQNITNISNLLPILISEKVPATFFVDPNRIQNYKRLIKLLSQYGDVSSLLDIGYLTSVNDTVNSLNDYYSQLQKLTQAKSELESITGTNVLGFMPLYGLYDLNTIKALIKSGYKFVFTDSLTDRSVPKTIVLGDSLIVSMTKTARDDYEVIRDFGLTDPDFQFYTYQEDIDRISFEGGMYIFKMHTEYQCKPENIGVVAKVINDLKKKNLWITTASSIENWWAKRNYVEVRVNRRGERRIALTISNLGKQTVNGLIIQVDINQPASNITMSSEIIGTKLAKYDYDKTNNTLYVHIDGFKPNESRTYYLDYDNPAI